MSDGSSAINAIILATIVVLLFLAFRAVLLWYWKINTIVERLDSIVAELKKSNAPG